MWVGLDLSSTESRLVAEFLTHITSSIEVSEALRRGLPVLQRLLSADAVALGVSKPGVPDDYEWLSLDLPDDFLGAYQEMIPHDLVRQSVVARPNEVLVDSDMIPRRELERNFMYRHSRSCGADLEQVMAVMLHTGEEWSSGLSLYRCRKVPFEKRDQQILRLLTPPLANVVSNCRLASATQLMGEGLEATLDSANLAMVLLDANGREIGRTALATRLLEAHFGHAVGARLPPSWLEHFLRHLRTGNLPPRLVVEGEASRLKVGFVPAGGGSRWGLVMQEEPYLPSVPEALARKLTRREGEVVQYVLQGRTNREIATVFGSSEGTVKKHLQRTFQKLGVDGREGLFVAAQDHSAPFA